LHRWEHTAADIELRAGDKLLIPKRPSYVMVTGQVFNPTAVSYAPGHNAAWYLKQAGGPTEMANRKKIFVVRANGAVISDTSGLFTGNGLDVRLNPGDMVVVPERILNKSGSFKNLADAASLISSVALAARVAAGF
jgi:protein involved in polysaccharide export with SLBB domain